VLAKTLHNRLATRLIFEVAFSCSARDPARPILNLTR
jgi:hypothetical protein